MRLDFNLHPAIVFAATTGASILIFFTVRLLLGTLYPRASGRWPSLKRYVERTRAKGLPLVKKYGLIGLVAFVAIPLPATGVLGGTVLAWLLGMNWAVSLLAILPGAIIANGIITLSILGILQGTNPAG